MKENNKKIGKKIAFYKKGERSNENGNEQNDEGDGC